MIADTERKVQTLWFGGLVALAAAGIGLALAEIGPLAAAVVPGAGAAVAVLLEPMIGLVAMAGVMPFEDSIILASVSSLTKILGVAVAGAWVLSRLVRRESWKPVLNNAFCVLGVAFIALVAASALWAEHVAGLRNDIIRLGMMFTLGLLAVDLLRDWRRVEWLVRAVVVGALIAVAFTLPQYFGVGVRRAGEGVAGDVNATAMILVACFPLAVFLLRSSGALLWRLLGLIYATLAPLAVATTLSRMAFLVLPLVAVVEWWGLLRDSRSTVLVPLVTTVGVIIGLVFLPWDKVQERADTIVPYVTQSLGTEDHDTVGGSGRGYHLKVALAIFVDHPLAGAGWGNYGHLFRDRYQFEVPGRPADNLLYSSPRSPHSVYFGILADLGLVGIVLWAGLVGTGIWNAWRAYRGLSGSGESARYLMARGVLLSLGIFAIYGFYSELQTEKLFWLLLGVALAIRRLSDESGESVRREMGL